MGAGITANLADNREKIASAHGKARAHKEQVSEADRTTTRMARRNW